MLFVCVCVSFLCISEQIVVICKNDICIGEIEVTGQNNLKTIQKMCDGPIKDVSEFVSNYAFEKVSFRKHEKKEQFTQLQKRHADTVHAVGVTAKDRRQGGR